MKQILVIATDLDERNKMRNDLVDHYQNKMVPNPENPAEKINDLKKWGDDFILTNTDKYFKFEILSMRDYLSRLRVEFGKGYEAFDISAILKEINILHSFLRKSTGRALPWDKKEDDLPVINADE